MKNRQRKSFDRTNNLTETFKAQSILSRASHAFSQKKNFTYLKPESDKDIRMMYNYPVKLQNTQKLISFIPTHAVSVYVGKGNNSEIVKQIIMKRKNVILVEESEQPKFRWLPTTSGFRFQRLSNSATILFNHFEYHKEITNKQLLTRNLTYYCEKKRINLFDIIPPTFILNLTDLNFEINNARFVCFYNHFKPEELYSDKISLNIKRNVPSKIPIANIKPPIYKPNPCLFTKDSFLWLLKPTSLNRGRGIHVFQNLTQVQELINQYSSSKINHKIQAQDRIRSHSFVIQKYIEKPMLIKNRKFDVRVWVLLDFDHNVYMYREGYARTSSEKYTLAENALTNEYVHLTNNAIQKKAKNYGKNQSGNQLSFAYLSNYLQQIYGKSLEFSKIINKMKDLVKIVFQSVQKKINCNSRRYCFQLFGFDFMIDELCKVWLIEVNTNPCIELSSELLQNLIPQMLNDTFKLTFDKVFNVQQNNELNQINCWEKLMNLY